MKVKLPDPEIPFQDLIGGIQQRDQTVSVPAGQGFGHLRVLGGQVGQTQGYVFPGFNVVQEDLIEISQSRVFINLDQAGLKPIGNQKQSGRAHGREE